MIAIVVDHAQLWKVSEEMSARFVEAMTQYLRSIADWRRSRYDDDLRDRRNLQAAQGLDRLAAFVHQLPADDPRLVRLAALCMRGEIFEPGQQVHYEVGRFHFFSTEATFDGFLDHLVELAEADHREHGQFGGRQVPGDNPWREAHWEEES